MFGRKSKRTQKREAHQKALREGLIFWLPGGSSQINVYLDYCVIRCLGKTKMKEKEREIPFTSIRDVIYTPATVSRMASLQLITKEMPDVKRSYWYAYENNLVVVHPGNEELAQKIRQYILNPKGSDVVPPEFLAQLRKERKEERRKAAEAEQSGAFKAVTEAADKWVRMGVDGFRLDAVKHIYHNAYNDENPTFLKKFYDRMNESYKAAGGEGDFYMVGEMLDEADKAAPYYRGLPALFEFTFWYKLKWALQNGIGCYFVKDILDVQPLYAQYRSDYIEATKLSNHDEDRTGSDLGQSAEKMKVAAAVLLTAQGAPYIYQGEELGYWGTKSNGDEYVRTPILWDKAGNELASGSLSGKIDKQMLTPAISVEAQADDDGSLLNLYLTFARLRNTYPVLAQGKMVKHPVYNDGNTSQQSIAAWYRELDGERMLVVHNFGREEQILTLTDQPDKAVGVSGEVKLQRGDASSKLLMGAWSSVVFTL